MGLSVDQAFQKIVSSDDSAAFQAVKEGIISDIGETDFDQYNQEHIFVWRMRNGGKFIGNERVDVPIKTLLTLRESSVNPDCFALLAERADAADASIGMSFIRCMLKENFYYDSNIDPRYLAAVSKALCKAPLNEWAKFRRRARSLSWFPDFSNTVIKLRAEYRKKHPLPPKNVSSGVITPTPPTGSPNAPTGPIATPLQASIRSSSWSEVMKNLPKSKYNASLVIRDNPSPNFQ